MQKLEKTINEESIRLNEIYKHIQNFEVIFDAALLSSSVAKIKEKVKKIETSIEILESEELKNKGYQENFSAAQLELKTTRDNCLKIYIEKYGPFASILQKRLRTPYGFDEITLRKDKGEFIVEVKRKNEKLIPSDYFSASEINIISLSLFLGATLTQTWSKFSTILLDDPVTHFDDLNVYSFIDLLRSIILSEESKRGHQFIISTCEDKFYHLLRQKLNIVSNRVKFFVFKSIGEKGPIWEEEL